MYGGCTEGVQVVPPVFRLYAAPIRGFTTARV